MAMLLFESTNLNLKAASAAIDYNASSFQAVLSFNGLMNFTDTSYDRRESGGSFKSMQGDIDQIGIYLNNNSQNQD